MSKLNTAVRRAPVCRECGQTDRAQFYASDARQCKACRRIYNRDRKRELARR